MNFVFGERSSYKSLVGTLCRMEMLVTGSLGSIDELPQTLLAGRAAENACSAVAVGNRT